MPDLEDYIQKVYIDPTSSFGVTQDDPTDLKVEIHQPAAKETFEVVQDTPADLTATVTQAAKDRTVTCDTPANLKAEIHQPAAKETFEVVQDTPADLTATVTQAAKDRTVTCDTPANLKAQVEPISGAEFDVTREIPTGATQVAKGTTAQNETVSLHTVTTGKTFYLCLLHMWISNESASNDSAIYDVSDGDGTRQYSISFTRMPDAQFFADTLQFPVPLEIPAGYKFRIISPAASYYARGFIHGYEK